MGRLPQLVVRAWRLRHDREALVSGLNRLGIRALPGTGRYETRSPRVGAASASAWAGHVKRSLAELERLASAGGREGIDAILALADWDLTHQQPARALARLEICDRLPRDGQALLLEARRLVDEALPEPLTDVNARLKRRTLPTVVSQMKTLDDLRCMSTSPPFNGPLITVIVPVFNGADTIETALGSLLAQTWRNLQIIVVDDASTDHTLEVVRAITDPRVMLLEQSTNQGPYAARNKALAVATGEFVTVHDADDWAHPDRITVQAMHHLDHPGVVATTTALVRMTHDLRTVRRGIPHGRFVGYNHASLMLRTSTLRDLGGWDPVRFGADSELEARLVALHGKKSVVHLFEDTPLTIARSDSRSLTGSTTTGLGSSLTSTGARHLYAQSYSAWHRGLTPATARLERHDDTEPFPCPSLVRRRTTTVDHLDVVMLSDLALPGGTTSSNLTEISANEQAGWHTGLVHNRNPRFRDIGLNSKYFDACSDRTRLLCAGESVSCDVLVIKYPPSALRVPDVFPDIDVRHDVVLIANQTPMTGYSGDHEPVYSIVDVNREVVERFGRAPLWCPIGPVVRHAIETHHGAELADIRWSQEDWVEIIDVNSWHRPTRPDSGSLFKVGRHGRDSTWKWPTDARVFESAFPTVAPYVVEILGGADHARKIIGRIPDNWVVHEFDTVSPADFLAGLDAFVHVAHPDMEEGFGRAILEALATGVPVVTEPRFATPFGDAVIAVEPLEIYDALERLRSDDNLYETMVRRGIDLAVTRYGFSVHHARVDALRR